MEHRTRNDHMDTGKHKGREHPVVSRPKIDDV